MDIMLERILSLIPKKPDGKFVHGSKKEFCEKIGVNTTVLSQWLSEFSKSYEQYAYKIAETYNVSVDWLYGRTDNPTPKAKDTGNADILQFLKDNVYRMSNKDLAEAMRFLAESLGNKE